MAGRHEDEGSTAALWTPRVREKLGAIGDRLVAHAPAEDYFTSRRVPGRLQVDAEGKIRIVENDPDAESDAVEG